MYSIIFYIHQNLYNTEIITKNKNLPCYMNIFVWRNIKDIVFPIYKYYFGAGNLLVHPYFKLTQLNKIPESQQVIKFRSLPNGLDLCGTNMNHGQVYLLTHFIIDYSKQEIYLGEIFIYMLWFQA